MGGYRWVAIPLLRVYLCAKVAQKGEGFRLGAKLLFEYVLDVRCKASIAPPRKGYCSNFGLRAVGLSRACRV